ncbi:MULTISPECIES: class I SAM-dependent methyltransferase [Caballeronia]|uniref:Dimethylmenaquinone methyltransferase n=1 Tax=Caballeronia zhejiangensis TaxID=871203 RepID=A0A656QHH9_9BURK|nr:MULTISPECIES: class I SAM-dependent methyltransferase [Caballeronia]EKS70046.1 demethylmenaquinone methyltransferase [Burkholderia sp. SJ98]KDR27561.1 dimethylmenaquinone methyltransferase [Caballeronia zhejiangensis]MDR5790739.1 class I SAM-dependent methyltransferase [Caballeronia sp. LP003]
MTSHRRDPLDKKVPHEPLTSYYADESKRRVWLRGIFDRTASDYDAIERVMALGSGSWYRNRALRSAGLARGMRVLDVGMGTGLVTREAVAITGDPALVTGVDPSPGMVGEAHLPIGVQTRIGTAEDLPCENAAYDFLSMGFALRHVSDLSKAFDEYFRVLAPGGRLCVLEITRPGHGIGIAALKFYMRGVVPTIARIVGKKGESVELMRYYWDTIEACVPPADVIAAIERAGFIDVRRDVELGIFSAYCATKPAR